MSRRGKKGGGRKLGNGVARPKRPKREGATVSPERRVVEALAASDRGPLKTKELARELEIEATGYRAFRRLLTGLEAKGTIVRMKGHRYAVAASIDLVTGFVSITKDGHGFVRLDGAGEDVYVPAHRLKTAMNGDRVSVRIEGRRRGRSPDGSVLRVLERARDTAVGVIHITPKVTYVVPLDARMKKDVLIARGEEGDAEDGDVVVARLTSYGEGRVGPTGSVEEVLGKLTDPGVDVLAVAHGFGLALDFPEEVTAAAEASAAEGIANPGLDRVDRTDLLALTIDPADAKDHDDALSIVELEQGEVEVGIHIADVSHYVPRGGLVDLEAEARGTSVYLVDRTVPMLPRVLSNDVCSLNPGTDRFAVSAFIVLDREGQVLRRRYERTVILCRHALSYEEAQEVLTGARSVNAEVDAALRLLDDCARRVRSTRRARGALDLDLPEAKVVLDEEGKPIDIRRRDRLESHRLVEDYMVLANEVVANDMEASDLATMYRVHERPSPEKVDALVDTLSRFGVKLTAKKSLKPAHLQRVLDAVRGRQEETVVNNLVLRSLSRARYHTENLGHFGLASSAYLHFTSPIRRYPDLVVHRVLAAVLIHRSEAPYLDREALVRSAEECSAREQAAAEAERSSVALKKVEFMERHVGDDFSGRVSGVAAFGFFVTLEDFFVDGLVHVSGLSDDFYHYRERDQALRGEREGRSYRLGDRVQVQVVRVDKEARHVDFRILRKLSGPAKEGPPT